MANAQERIAGFEYIVSDRYSISATYFQTIDPQDVAEIEYAFSFALTRMFQRLDLKDQSICISSYLA